MPIETIVLPTQHRDADIVAGFAAPIAACPSATAAGIFVLQPSPPPPAATTRAFVHVAQPQCSASALASTIENIIRDASLPANAGIWFPAALARIQRALTNASDGCAVSAILTVITAAADARELTIRITATGAVAGLLVHAGARRASVTTIVHPESAARPSFTHTVEGMITGRDAIVIGSAAIATALPHAMYTHALLALHRASGIAYLNHALRMVDAPTGAVVIARGGARATAHSQRSLDAFIATTTATTQYLAPSLKPALTAYWAELHASLARIRARQPLRRGQPPRVLVALLEGIRIAFRTAGLGGQTALTLLHDGLRWAFRSAAIAAAAQWSRAHGRHSAPHTRAPRAMRAPPEHIPSFPFSTRVRSSVRSFARTLRIAFEQRARRARQWFCTLPPASRTLFVLAGASALLFLSSTALLWFRRTREVDVAAYNVTVNRIQDLQATTEAQLLFGDRAAAAAQLLDAMNLLATLPRTSRARRDRAEVIARELDAALDRTRLLTRITKPLLLARAGAALSFARIGDLTLAGGSLVAIPPEGNALALIRPRDGNVTVREVHPPLAQALRRAVALDDRLILLLDGQGQLSAVDVMSGERTTYDTPLSGDDAVDVDTTRGRIYILHRNGSVTRHDRTAGGVGNGTMVVPRAAAEAAAARSLVVSGSISIGFADGTLATYTSGRPTNTPLVAHVDPPLATAPVLAAAANGEPIFIADAPMGRVAAVQRNGDLIGQVQSDELRGITRVVADATGATLYVLHGSEVSVVVAPKVR